MIVKKSVRMATMLKAPVLGMVENMRSLVCPDCGAEINLFDDGGEEGRRPDDPRDRDGPGRDEDG